MHPLGPNCRIWIFQWVSPWLRGGVAGRLAYTKTTFSQFYCLVSLFNPFGPKGAKRGPKGIFLSNFWRPSDPKGIPRETQVEAKRGPMEPKVGPSGSQRAPNGMPKGSRRRQVCSKVEPRCILCFPCLLLFILHALPAFSC